MSPFASKQAQREYYDSRKRFIFIACKQCGNEFVVTTQGSGRLYKYCSQTCRDAYVYAIALDVLQECITPQTGNTACNAIGKLLKVKELEIKYGLSGPSGQPKRLELTD